jgi:uncharacterized protein (TIGR02996 family)
LIAVLEVRRRAWDPGTNEVTDHLVEMRRREGERLELTGLPSLVLAVNAVSADRVAVVVVGELAATMDPPLDPITGDRELELAIGDRVRFTSQPEPASSWELRLVTIRSVDARTMPGGSPLERDLLAAIRAAPDDDPVRLVYADWLLSQPAQGDRARGELVQLQCALNASPSPERRREIRARERELLGSLPAPSFGDGVRLELVWSRGFLERCHGELSDFARHVVNVFQVAPLLATLELDVALMPNQSQLQRLATIEQLGQIRELAVAPATGVTPGRGDDLLVALAPALTSLRRLRVSAMNVGARGVTSLLDARVSAQLATLDLTGNDLGGVAVRTLADCSRLEPVALRLARCAIRAAETEALATARWLAEVEELELGDNDLRDPGALVLARVPFRRLRRLSLGSCGIGKTGARALLGSPHLGKLRHLRLHQNPIGDLGATALARSRARSIEDLDLQACEIGEAGVSALAETPSMRAARRWRLGGNPIGDAGARAIAESAHLRGLTSLDLARCRVGDEGAIALAACAWPALEISLAQNPIGNVGAAALIASPIRSVTLSAERLSESLCTQMRERFGDAAISSRSAAE